ncbi:hypothetical protein B0O80DRAFT_497096 [Mortierella sp. GBAus27b]|nr:hypothetical protein B0O80DRAFT_497096 [Mortierella sp. GBAus27b]
MNTKIFVLALLVVLVGAVATDPPPAEPAKPVPPPAEPGTPVIPPIVPGRPNPPGHQIPGEPVRPPLPTHIDMYIGSVEMNASTRFSTGMLLKGMVPFDTRRYQQEALCDQVSMRS